MYTWKIAVYIIKYSKVPQEPDDFGGAKNRPRVLSVTKFLSVLEVETLL